MSTFLENNPGGYQSSYDDIFLELNKFEQFSILEQISLYLWEFHKSGSIGNRDINIQSLSLIMITLLDSNFDSSNSKPVISAFEFRKINLMANSATDIIQEDNKEFTIWYIQTHYSQLVLNPTSPYYKIILFIFLFCSIEEIQIRTLHPYFVELFGMTGEEFGTALWTILTFFQEHRRIKNLENCGIKNIKSLRQTLNIFSLSLDEIRNKFSTLPKYKCNYWTARFNPFRDYPIVTEKIENENHYWVPSPHFLYLPSTDNLYYYLFDHFLKKEKLENPKNKDPGKNPFAVDFGKAIEQIAVKFTDFEIGSNRQVISDFKFIAKDKSNSDSADIHIIENKSKNLCLVQIKGKRVRLSSQGGDINSYLSDIDNSLLYGVKQNYSLLSQPGFQKAIEEKSDWKFNLNNITFLIIYVEGFYDINLPKIKEYIDTEIEKIRDKNGININIPTAFISLEHYLRLIEWSADSRRSISDKIRDYVSYLKNPSKENNLGASGFAHTFDEYIRIKTKGQSYKNSLSKKVYDRFFEDIKSRIHPSHESIIDTKG